MTAPTPPSDGQTVTPEYRKDACCAAWLPQTEKINGPIVLAQARNPHLTQSEAFAFKAWEFCPWCGASRRVLEAPKPVAWSVLSASGNVSLASVHESYAREECERLNRDYGAPRPEYPRIVRPLYLYSAAPSVSVEREALVDMLFSVMQWPIRNSSSFEVADALLSRYSIQEKV